MIFLNNDCCIINKNIFENTNKLKSEIYILTEKINYLSDSNRMNLLESFNNHQFKLGKKMAIFE